MRLDPAEKRAIVEVYDPWKEEGIREGMAQITVRQLTHRFGTPPASVVDQVNALPKSSLDDLAIEMLNFSSLREAEEWLARHPAMT